MYVKTFLFFFSIFIWKLLVICTNLERFSIWCQTFFSFNFICDYFDSFVCSDLVVASPVEDYFYILMIFHVSKRFKHSPFSLFSFCPLTVMGTKEEYDWCFLWLIGNITIFLAAGRSWESYASLSWCPWWWLFCLLSRYNF